MMVVMQVVSPVLVIDVDVLRQPQRHFVTFERHRLVVEREMFAIQLRLRKGLYQIEFGVDDLTAISDPREALERQGIRFSGRRL